ncbi:MAG: hypothetical protein JWO05_3344 [Gemmatimonadetes bacterium]|nr:hypothetical protein [Gemmatimonadota bacterium]
MRARSTSQRAGTGIAPAVALAAVVAAMTVGCGSAPSTRPAPARAAQDSIATGYAKTTREANTSAIGSLSSKDIDAMRVTRIEELIQGHMAGVQVVRTSNGGFSLRIRGASSLGYGGDAEPLYVLDGMPMQSTDLGNVLDGVSPYDIARIDVLKDAGSTASYGVRGANGVVLITTKRSKAGKLP